MLECWIGPVQAVFVEIAGRASRNTNPNSPLDQRESHMRSQKKFAVPFKHPLWLDDGNDESDLVSRAPTLI